MQVLCGNEDRKSNINNKRRDNLKNKRQIESTVSQQKNFSCWNGGDKNGSKNGKECRLWKLWYFFFVCFVLLLAARATKTTMSGQNAAFGRSRRQLTDRGRNRFKTQHQRLATRCPSARCNVTRAVRPREPRTAKRRFVS